MAWHGNQNMRHQESKNDPFREVLNLAPAASLPALQRNLQTRASDFLHGYYAAWRGLDPDAVASETTDGLASQVVDRPIEDDEADGEEGVGEGGVDTVDWDGMADELDEEPNEQTEFAKAKVDGIGNCVAELEASFGRVLPRSSRGSLPHLFMPEKWSDGQILAYASQGNKQTDICDDARRPPKCPPPKQEECDTWHPDTVASRRTAGTLYLAWVRLALDGRLDTCHLTGLRLYFPLPGGTTNHPLKASLAAHHTHGWPVDYGWTHGWPTSLGQFRLEWTNVTVESSYANKWRKGWRYPALLATLLRRTDWLLNRSGLLGLSLLTGDQVDRVRHYCSQGVCFTKPTFIAMYCPKENKSTNFDVEGASTSCMGT